MDFARRKDESERGYHTRVLQELKTGSDWVLASQAFEGYRLGRIGIEEFERQLVAAFPNSTDKEESLC